MCDSGSLDESKNTTQAFCARAQTDVKQEVVLICDLLICATDSKTILLQVGVDFPHSPGFSPQTCEQ